MEPSNRMLSLFQPNQRFDDHSADWGGLLNTEDYEEIGYWVRLASDRNEGGCFGILEGGYNHDVLGENVLALIQGMARG